MSGGIPTVDSRKWAQGKAPLRPARRWSAPSDLRGGIFAARWAPTTMKRFFFLCAMLALPAVLMPATPMTAKTESLVLGGGCFWCTEAAYELLPGVKSVVSGYAGGKEQNPTYEQICAKVTGHAEVIKIDFDPAVVSPRFRFRATLGTRRGGARQGFPNTPLRPRPVAIFGAGVPRPLGSIRPRWQRTEAGGRKRRWSAPGKTRVSGGKQARGPWLPRGGQGPSPCQREAGLDCPHDPRPHRRRDARPGARGH